MGTTCHLSMNSNKGAIEIDTKHVGKAVMYILMKIYCVCLCSNVYTLDTIHGCPCINIKGPLCFYSTVINSDYVPLVP